MKIYGEVEVELHDVLILALDRFTVSNGRIIVNDILEGTWLRKR